MNKASSKKKTVKKYKTTIPPEIRKRMGIKIGDELLWRVQGEGKEKRAIVTLRPRNMGEYMLGLGKEVWEGIDTDEYLHQLRSESKY
ncbi:MAG: AbrB/MazE/SpoVT family DNA-binding domain-containing protein [Parcubacteria group bacterium]|nr:AbrB/MazE/SpoVT family DNA-binding domain-containing protein [Parcubacteria group bacterium]